MSVEQTEHRGIRWQRSGAALRWYDEGSGAWVRYKPGRDAPPRPPGWEPTRRGLLPADVHIDRPGWRTPYRIVPIVIVLAIIAIGTAQALSGSGGQDAAEAAAAKALVGRCLASSGGPTPGYSPKPVDCASPGAVVKVTSTAPGTPGSPGCPSGTLPVVLGFPGVRSPHQLCTVPNGG